MDVWAFSMMVFIWVCWASVRLSCLAKKAMPRPPPSMPNPWPCIGGGGVSAVVCDLATALPSRTAKVATSKRKRNDFMCDSLRCPGTPRSVAYTDRNTGRGEKAVKNRSTVVKFCQWWMGAGIEVDRGLSGFRLEGAAVKTLDAP